MQRRHLALGRQGLRDSHICCSTGLNFDSHLYCSFFGLSLGFWRDEPAVAGKAGIVEGLAMAWMHLSIRRHTDLAIGSKRSCKTVVVPQAAIHQICCLKEPQQRAEIPPRVSLAGEPVSSKPPLGLLRDPGELQRSTDPILRCAELSCESCAETENISKKVAH